MKWIIVFCSLVIGFCSADLPTDLPDLDDFEAIKERCDRKGGAGTFDKVKTAQEKTVTCIKDIINVDTVKSELEEAKKTGSMDEVFGKYCKKRPQIRECIKKTYDAIQPCLEESEKKGLNFTADMVTKIGEFACFRDGDRLAMFIAEGGLECLSSRVDGIKNCINETLKFNPATFSPNSIPDLTVDKKKCDDLSTIQQCVVKDLEDNCKRTTPANIVDALFRFIKKNACKDVKRKRSIRLRRDLRKILATYQTEIIPHLLKQIEASCKKYGGTHAYDKLMAAFNTSNDCLRTNQLLITPYNTYQNNLANCTEESRRLLEDCLFDGEKYTSDFILELLQSLVEFLYRNTENIISTDPHVVANCIRTLNQGVHLIDLRHCFMVTDTHRDVRNNTRSPKSEVCRRAEENYGCAVFVVKEICINDLRIHKLIDDMFSALNAPCKKMLPV